MKISRRSVARWIAPSAGLAGSVFIAVLGLVLLIGGLTLSFRVLLSPLRQSILSSWSNLLNATIGISSNESANHILGGMLLAIGVLFTNHGIRSVFKHILSVLSPQAKPGASMTAVYVRRMQLARGPRIVTIGGGTGLSTLLRGLKQYTSNITAIVTVTDDGGSSGRLSEELGIIPPGDLRNCLVALADAEKLMTDLFQYRFGGKSGSLSGHSLGNLLIAGLIEQSGGDFEKALLMASEVLAIRGRVMPSTLERVRLRALLEDGQEVCGETSIVSHGARIRRMYIDPSEAAAFPEALEAIRDAEMIVMGPGSVYTSIIPNLLVPGIAAEIEASSAIKAYVCNVMTQPGESQGFSAQEHVAAIEANVPNKIIDYVLVNTALPSKAYLERYRGEGQFPVHADLDRLIASGKRPLSGNFMSESDYVRHDPLRIANSLMELIRA